MKHIMIDAYGISSSKLDDFIYIYNVLNLVVYENNLLPISPPILAPYYYGKTSDDGGISAFVLLKGGHVTIHTFSYRKCYFFDIMYDDYIDTESISNKLNLLLPAEQVLDHEIDLTNSNFSNQDSKYNVFDDFGPHLIYECDLQEEISMQNLYCALDIFPKAIGMTQITRPFLMLDQINNPQYLSGIILLAESHISIHQNILKKKAYIDVFSCNKFEAKYAESFVKNLGGINISSHLITRGSKHNQLKTNQCELETVNNYWFKILNND